MQETLEFTVDPKPLRPKPLNPIGWVSGRRRQSGSSDVCEELESPLPFRALLTGTQSRAKALEC